MPTRWFVSSIEEDEMKTPTRLGIAGVSAGAIRRYRLLIVAVAGLLLIAAVSWSRISRLEDPLVESPVVIVTIPYPGASAEDVDAQVARPAEEALYGMENIDFIQSKSLPNVAILEMHFDFSAQMDSVTEAVRGKVLGIRKQLPPEVGDPIVYRAKISTYIATMVLAVTGNRSEGVLTDVAKRLKDDLLTVPGVATVTLRGAHGRAVRVQLDPMRIAQRHLTVEEVTERVRLSNVRTPAGEVPIGSLVTLLTVNHELKDADGVGKIPVGTSPTRDGATQTVLLRDVAEVRDDFRAATERMIQDGIPAVGLEVRFRPEENAIEIGKRVQTLLDKDRPTVPLGVELRIAHNQPEWVQHSLSNLVESLVEGVVLVMLVITFGMGWRAGLVVALVLPLAMAGGVIGLQTFGFSLDQVSMAGLIVALGLLVDDAVVVAESIQLLRDRGLGAVRAAVLGTARVFRANNGTTAVACASFIPLFFIGGDVGRFIRGLPTAVIFALVTSLLVAQLLTPWIGTLLLEARDGVAPITDDMTFDRYEDSAHHERNVVLQAVRAAYRWAIPRVMDQPFKVIGFSTVLLVGSCLLLPLIGIQFFPKADKPAVFVGVQMPRGTEETLTAATVARAMSELRKDPEVRSTSAIVGGGYPAVFLGRASPPASKDMGDIFVQLTKPSTTELVARLRLRLASIPGANIIVQELYSGAPMDHPVVIRVQGDDPIKLGQYAERIKQQLRNVPGAVNVSDTMSDSIPVTNVAIDAERAMSLGITPAQVGSALRSVYGEDKVTSFRQRGDTVEVIVEASPAKGSVLGAVRDTPVSAGKGSLVPPIALGDVRFARGYADLRRRNTRRVAEVAADVNGATLPQDVVARIRPFLETMKWENGYSYTFAGEETVTEQGFKSLGVAALVTIVIIFVLLVTMFGSLSRAALVLAAVPFALIGAIPGLCLTGNAFGFMAFLGLVALIGVYVNHKIYFVDRMTELMQRGVEWRQAIEQAGIDRLRPVVLTAMTAILGLLPLTLGGGALWSAFGWVNVFGLAVSIPLSLLLLPAFLAASFRLRPPVVREIEFTWIDRSLDSDLVPRPSVIAVQERTPLPRPMPPPRVVPGLTAAAFWVDDDPTVVFAGSMKPARNRAHSEKAQRRRRGRWAGDA
jgi:multidrug efflux pump subunit AcrB